MRCGGGWGGNHDVTANRDFRQKHLFQKARNQDQNENIMPTKRNSTGRIDGIVASIIGVSRAVAAENAPLTTIMFV